MPEILVGQIFKDCDKRMPNRYMRVERIDGEHAICIQCDATGRPITARPTRLLLRRMRPTSTGWELQGA
jgi:hypothetical protein